MKKNVFYACLFCIAINSQAQLQQMNSVQKSAVADVPFLGKTLKSFVPVQYNGSNDSQRYISNIDVTEAIETYQKNTTDQENINKAITELNTNSAALQLTVIKEEKASEKKADELGKAMNELKALEKKVSANKNDSLKNVQLSSQVRDLKARITTLSNEKNYYDQKLDELRNRINTMNENTEKLIEQNKQLSEKNDILAVKVLKDKEEITELLKTQREYILLRYKTDSTELNSFFNRFRANVDAVRKELDDNKNSFAPGKVISASFDSDSANLAPAVLDFIKLSEDAASAKAELENDLGKLISQYSPLLTAFNNASQLLGLEGLIPIVKTDSVITERKKALLAAKNRAEESQQAFSLRYNIYKDVHTQTIAHLQTILGKKKAIQQSDNVSILGNLTSPLNDSKILIPGFDVLAYKKFTDSNLAIFGQTRFIVASNKSDTNKLNNSTRLFVPEASSLGFMVDFSFGFDQATYKPKNSIVAKPYHTLGINFGLYYLQKELLTADADKNPFTIGLLQTKLGIEKTIVRNSLAAFATLNGIYIGKGLESYKKHYDESERMQWFVEVGLKSYLTLSKDDKTNLLMELRFLPVNSLIKKTTGTTDKFIPLIKIGFARRFDF